jgi:hypothetical protein
MPNRILKESICTSENIEQLSGQAEVFFYRLLVQCDDFGRMDARPAILRARCYPLRTDRVTERDIASCLEELVETHLICLYDVDQRPYLQVKTWDKHQQKRAKHSKYPDMQASDSNCNQVIADADNSPREARSENTRNEKREARSESAAPECNEVVTPLPSGGVPPAPSRPQKRVSPPKTETPALNMDDPAVVLYRDIIHLTPNATQRKVMAQGEITDLAKWQGVLENWLAHSWNPRNVPGMLDSYHSGNGSKPQGKEHPAITAMKNVRAREAQEHGEQTGV